MIPRIFTITWSHPKVSKGSDPQRSAPIIPNCSAQSRLRAISTSFPLSLSISLTLKLQLLASRRFSLFLYLLYTLSNYRRACTLEYIVTYKILRLTYANPVDEE